jgi:hypothetical protein
VLNFLTQYGQIIAFFAQLIYWLVIAVVSVYAVLLFKRLVDFRAGVTPKPKPARQDDGGKSSEDTFGE